MILKDALVKHSHEKNFKETQHHVHNPVARSLYAKHEGDDFDNQPNGHEPGEPASCVRQATIIQQSHKQRHDNKK